MQQTQSPFGQQEQRGEATGSGFVIDKGGDILTNEHVVEGASKIQVSFGNKKPVDAEVVGLDTSNGRRPPEGEDRRREPEAADPR